jgi:hypothetical protein
LAPPLTVFFAGFLPAIFVCMYVSVFNNGVVLEGNGRETSGLNFELFWVAVGFSTIRTIKFLFVKKSRI